MRTYNQYCAAAKALDLIGQRWTLLIVRELLLRGASRYADLQHGLPGIASNLLAERLRELEQHGIVRRTPAPRPVATTLYELTERGAELRRVIDELVRWGGPLMAQRAPDDSFRSHWLIPPAELFLADATPEQPQISVEIRGDEVLVVIETAEGRVRARTGAATRPTATLDGPPEVIVGLLFGGLSAAQARRKGLRITGAQDAVSRLGVGLGRRPA